MNSHAEKVRAFWNDRARMGTAAGSNDVIAKQIEIDAIMSYMKDGLDVLDIGCGNGITAITIAEKYNLRLKAIDYANEMILHARELASKADLRGSLEFGTGDVRGLSKDLGNFDVVFTERVLINLNNWEEQKEALNSIGNLLKPRGIFVMCENSAEGLESTNALRAAADLPPIAPPWHNCYLRESNLTSFHPAGLQLKDIQHISSTYAFLSRVVNAWTAKQEGREPSYEAPVNALALKLPAFGALGQTKIWVWIKQ